MRVRFPLDTLKLNVMEYDIKELTDYLDRNGVEYTLDLNPSPEKIKIIEESIKRKNEIAKIMKKEFDNL